MYSNDAGRKHLTEAIRLQRSPEESLPPLSMMKRVHGFPFDSGPGEIPNPRPLEMESRGVFGEWPVSRRRQKQSPLEASKFAMECDSTVVIKCSSRSHAMQV